MTTVTREQMEALAQEIASVLRSGDIVTLRGVVGAGKTTFARALIRELTKDVQEITSPTFNLMQSYDVTLTDGKKDVLWHLDLYRLESSDEANSLGLREIWPHITLIEWPEVIERYLPQERLDITFDFTDDDTIRGIHFSGNDAWRARSTLVK